MKYFTEPSGKFVIELPTEWQYANVAADYEEKSPYSFQPYENVNWAFQISCYSADEKTPIENLRKQKFNTQNLDFTELRNDGDGFNMHIWGTVVEDHIFMVKYIYDTDKEEDKEINFELERVKEALSTIQLLSPDKRKSAFDLAKYDKFMASLAASFDLKNKALKNSSYIEFSIIIANQIDAYLRLSILMTEQLKMGSSELDIKYLYQSDKDSPIMERKIYSLAKENGIIDQAIWGELGELYGERNKMVHRYIISEFRTKQLLNIAYRYEVLCEKVRRIVRDIEDLQFEKGIGIYGTGQHPQAEPTQDYLNLLHSQINDKHLISEFERKIKNI